MLSALFGIIFGGCFIYGGIQIAQETVVPTYQSWQSMQQWQATSAYLLRISADSNTTQARYIYTINGVAYENNRVAVATFNDNIGSYHQQTAEQLKQAQQNNQPINIWYDPKHPSSSVIDRNMRWGLFSLISAFCSIFIFIGLLISYASLQSTGKKTTAKNRPSLSEMHRLWKQKQSNSSQLLSFVEFSRQYKPNQQQTTTESLPDHDPRPWLKNKQWRHRTLRSNAKQAMWGMSLFAVFWNAVSAPILFILPEELEKQNYPVLFALLFPLVGLFLIYKAGKIIQEWRRFGIIELHLDPYPGSIGGHVGGSLMIKKQADYNAQYKIELQCLYSYMSGSGDNRSRHESIKWSESGFAKKSLTGNCLQLRFRFDVPDNLPAADIEQKGDYYCWRLKLSAKLSTAELDSSYAIPVFKTKQYSRNIRHDLSAQAEKHRQIQTEASQTAISSGHFSNTALKRALRFKTKSNKQIFYFPMFRNKALSLFSLIFAAGFGFASYSINYHFANGDFMAIAMLVFSLPFTLVALIAGIAAIYLPLNNLTVSLSERKLTVLRRLFIFPVQYKQINHQEIKNIAIKSTGSTGQGSRQIKHYKLQLQNTNLKNITIAEDIDGEDVARQLKEYICKQLYIDC